MKIFKILSIIFWTGMVICCTSVSELEPSDKRPVKSIQVGDATEAALIEQELDIEIKYIENNMLYFYVNSQNTIAELKNLDYRITEVSPGQISFRLVKMVSKNDLKFSIEKNDTFQNELQEYNIKLMKREEDHWVIHGSLENLRKIEDLGYKLEELDQEIRPRSIEIIVPSREDIQKVNELGIDIYSSGPQEDSYIIYGGAFDYQIDLLESTGFIVNK